MASKPGTSANSGRATRLAEELRANLQRRKAQTRSRRTGEADERPEGLGAADGGDDELGSPAPGAEGKAG